MPIKISNFIAKSIIFIKLTVLSLTTTQAQIIPDQTLGDETSTVTPGQTINGVPRELIQGGSIREKIYFIASKNLILTKELQLILPIRQLFIISLRELLAQVLQIFWEHWVF